MITFHLFEVDCDWKWEIPHSGAHAVEQDTEAVAEIPYCDIDGEIASDGIGVIAAAEAPDGIAHGIGIDFLDVFSFFCVINQFFDFGMPPRIIALGVGVIFKDILIKCHFVFIGHNQ